MDDPFPDLIGGAAGHDPARCRHITIRSDKNELRVLPGQQNGVGQAVHQQGTGQHEPDQAAERPLDRNQAGQRRRARHSGDRLRPLLQGEGDSGPAAVVPLEKPKGRKGVVVIRTEYALEPVSQDRLHSGLKLWRCIDGIGHDPAEAGAQSILLHKLAHPLAVTGKLGLQLPQGVKPGRGTAQIVPPGLPALFHLGQALTQLGLASAQGVRLYLELFLFLLRLAHLGCQRPGAPAGKFQALP